MRLSELFACECFMISVVFQGGLDYEKVLLKLGQNLSQETTLTYPVAKIDGFDVHLERNLFGIKLKQMVNKSAHVGEKITPDKLPANITYSQMLTNLDFVKVNLCFQDPKSLLQVAAWSSRIVAVVLSRIFRCCTICWASWDDRNVFNVLLLKTLVRASNLKAMKIREYLWRFILPQITVNISHVV